MAIGRERFSYQAAVEGDAPDVPEPLMEVVRDRDGWQGYWSHALGLIYRTARESRGNAAKADTRSEDNAWEYTLRLTDSEQEHHDYMRALIYRAKQSPRFWGVEDDAIERYCSRCRQVKPREEFRDHEYNCKPCTS